jgi:hypothetical protein
MHEDEREEEKEEKIEEEVEAVEAEEEEKEEEEEEEGRRFTVGRVLILNDSPAQLQISFRCSAVMSSSDSSGSAGHFSGGWKWRCSAAKLHRVRSAGPYTRPLFSSTFAPSRHPIGSTAWFITGFMRGL